jgi:hypothetical protein
VHPTILAQVQTLVLVQVAPVPDLGRRVVQAQVEGPCPVALSVQAVRCRVLDLALALDRRIQVLVLYRIRAEHLRVV